MPLSFGEPAPRFAAPTPSTPGFLFDTSAGRYVLLLFLPIDAAARTASLKLLAANQRLFDDVKACAFVVTPGRGEGDALRDMRGLRWFLDADRAIARLYRADQPHWLLLDPTLRVIDWAPADSDRLLALLESLPPPGGHAGVPLNAPVLVAPRILEPESCRALIALHEQDGGQFTGVMRDQGDRTVVVMDELKKRRDILLDDLEIIGGLRERFERRLFPLITLALGFKVTRVERYVVSCYDEADGGVFHAHRDNDTLGTAHRMFACSINLNEDFQGGDLRFAEFGPATYRPPAGGALVFSCSLMHEVLPVQRGRRYALLPFFYDESGAAKLADYRARTAQPETAL